MTQAQLYLEDGLVRRVPVGQVIFIVRQYSLCTVEPAASEFRGGGANDLGLIFGNQEERKKLSLSNLSDGPFILFDSIIRTRLEPPKYFIWRGGGGGHPAGCRVTSETVDRIQAASL